MKPRWLSGYFVFVILLVIVVSVGLARQWLEAMALRGELELARMETRDLARLRAENERLREKQISAAELERLRADHAALPRLRSELELLKNR